MQNITSIKEGGDESEALINDDTLIRFVDDYTQFLSLITNSFVVNNELDTFPAIQLSGIRRQDRAEENKASQLEAKENFEAEDSSAPGCCRRRRFLPCSSDTWIEGESGKAIQEGDKYRH